MSHGLGMTKHPCSWSRRKALRFSAMVGIVVPGLVQVMVEALGVASMRTLPRVEQEEVVDGARDLRDRALSGRHFLLGRLHERRDRDVTGAVRQRDDADVIRRAADGGRLVRD